LALPVAGVLLLLIGGVWMLLEKRSTPRPATVVRPEKDLARRQMGVAYRTARRMLARHVPLATGQTPHEYEAAVLASGVAPAAKQELAALTYLFVQVHYTARPPAPIDQKPLRDSLARLRRALR
jgi:hypothetical protein